MTRLRLYLSKRILPRGYAIWTWIGDEAGSTAAGRTQGHGAEETEGPGRVKASASVPAPASAHEWVEHPTGPYVDSVICRRCGRVASCADIARGRYGASQAEGAGCAP